jgi:glutamate-5-semialdehyde dehydrogenase
LLNDSRIDGIIGGTKKVAALPDPLGRVINSRTLENGLELTQFSVPFGVVGMIYEARPNVTVDAAVILLMSGNAALMRGSSTAKKSNEVLVKVIKQALSKSEISPEVIQLIPSDDRDTVRALLHARGKVDLVIPRGSAALIRTVVDEALVPTIETGAGVCHVFVDKDANLEKALPIVINAKTHRPSVCNAAETLLVHQEIADKFLPIALKRLSDAKVKLHCDSQSLQIANRLGIPASKAEEKDWSTEYGTLEINVGVVTDVDGAMAHINKYGTQHTEAIVTENEKAAQRFIALSDCAAVMVNASTRFTDGEEMGFGAEIGISNQKLHARGPMGLDQMTTTTWVVKGSGQIRK